MKSIVGKVLRDRYYIVQELSNQGSSITYLSEDRKAVGNRLCEIERLQPQYDSEAVGFKSWQNIQKLFESKASIFSGLSNYPQIPQLLDYFECDRNFYLVREYIDGQTLEEKIKDRLLDENEAIIWLQDALNILEFIHQRSIIHLNIRPYSLLQRRGDGRIILTNFSWIKHEILSINQSSYKLNSLDLEDRNLIPIEQQEGKPNFTSDIYSLGRTIIYALTGEFSNLIDPKSLANIPINSAESREFPEKKISHQLIKILNNMVCERSPDRYQSATEVLAELDRRQSVITLPPPFMLVPPPEPTSVKAQPKKLKIGQLLLWFLLILPFIGASIALWIGINKNMYRQFTDYINEDYNFVIKYPQDWSTQELNDPITGGVVVFSSPLESPSDPFRERVYISVEYLSSNFTTLDEYTQLIIDKIDQEKGEEIEIYEDKKININGSPARMVIYSRQQGNLLLRQMEAFTIKDNRVYIVTYIAERAKFSKFLDTAKKMLNSWEISMINIQPEIINYNS
ncbi:MAG: PsbP-related protein [Pleurocapsa sp.]